MLLLKELQTKSPIARIGMLLLVRLPRCNRLSICATGKNASPAASLSARLMLDDRLGQDDQLILVST